MKNIHLKSLVLCFFIILPRLFSIEQAEPEYSYESFLKIPYDDFLNDILYFEEKDDDDFSLWKLKNCLYLNDFVKNSFAFHNRSVSFIQEAIYRENLYNSSTEIKTKQQDISLNIYDWKHKNEDRMLNLSYNQSFNVNLGDNLFALRNNSDFWYYKNSPLTNFENLKSSVYLDWVKKNWGISLGIKKPFGTNNFYSKNTMVFLRNHETVIGGGIAYFDSIADAYYPQAFIQHYFYRPLLLRSFFTVEYLDYPLSGYFKKMALNYKSNIPVHKNDFSPVITKKFQFDIEHSSADFFQKASLILSRDDGSFEYSFDDDINSIFFIEKNDKKVFKTNISYLLQRGYNKLGFNLNLPCQQNFNPLAELFFDVRLTIQEDNFFEIKPGFLYQYYLESSNSGSNRSDIPYLSVKYNLEFFDRFVIELGANYKHFDFKNAYYANKYNIFLNLAIISGG